MVTIRDAATVMLIRENPDLEVFMLRRTPHAVFGPGAYVFPGGAVDDTDHLVPIHGRTPETVDLLLDRVGAMRWWAAAAREAFEESGLLLVDEAVAANLGAQRDAVNAGTLDFASLLNSESAAVSGGSMHVFSHWLTPVGSPRRYDTWFFVAPAPIGQLGTHDNFETVESEWVRPSEMLRRWRNDQVDLIMPTMRSLRVLETFDSATQLFAALQHSEDDAISNQQTPLLVNDASAQRVALHEHERLHGEAHRGWRMLRSNWQDDVEIERADYAQPNEVVAQ